jgi:S1-C subfamily serine protease
MKKLLLSALSVPLLAGLHAQPQCHDQCDWAPVEKKSKVELEEDEESKAEDGANDQSERMQRELRRQFQGLDLEQFFGDDFFKRFFEGHPGQGQGQRQRRSEDNPWGQLAPRQQPKISSQYDKTRRRALAEFRPVVKDVRQSVATVFLDGEQVSLATIVSADGYALTKSSMVRSKGKLECEFHDGLVATAKVVDRNKPFDLALIKIEAKDLKPVVWNTAPEINIGTLLAAGSVDEDPLAVGVVSVPPRNLDSSKKGYLGVAMELVENGVKLTQVSEESPAAAAGLKVGDIVTAVDGAKVTTPMDLTSRIIAKKPEDEVHIAYQREGEDKVAVATLKSRDDGLQESQTKRYMRMGDMTARMGGQGNEVADGFPVALQSDLLIETNACGGPIVDIDGKVIGVNIARAERTKTYAIPAYSLEKMLGQVNQGKLTEVKDMSDLKRDAKKASRELEEAKKKIEELESKAREAQEALDKADTVK